MTTAMHNAIGAGILAESRIWSLARASAKFAIEGCDKIPAYQAAEEQHGVPDKVNSRSVATPDGH